MNKLFSKIPNMKDLLSKLCIDDIDPHWQKQIASDYLDALREQIKNGTVESIDSEFIVSEIRAKIYEVTNPKFKPLINGTGVVIHTNLGRSTIHERLLVESIKSLSEYSNLEYDLKTGKRGSRYDLVTEKLCLISGAEDALVVNNNAAAVMLILSALATDKEVIVSRGELVEIGGSFRIPEVMKLSGCQLIEVGTTNKTHLYDYENALSTNTGLILKVHTSNYKVVGFTESVSSDLLSNLTRENGIPLYEDLGSGSFDLGIKGETKTIKEIVNTVDIVSFSGDKLLGGPQCGIILGKQTFIEKLKKHQLLRALRVDKFTLSILDQVLSSYFKNESESRRLNKTRTYLMMNPEQVRSKVETFINEYQPKLDSKKIRLISCSMVAEIGAGSLPTEGLESYGLIIEMALKPDRGSKILRTLDLPIIARIENDSLMLDFRTIEEYHYKAVYQGLKVLEAHN